MKNTLAVIVLSASTLLTGCASIMNGTTQQLAVTVQPSDAMITLTNENGEQIEQKMGSMYYKLKRGNGFFSSNNYVLQLNRQDYQTEIIPIESSASGWYILGNILVGGFIGWLIVDPITGGMWTYSAKGDKDISNLKVVMSRDVPPEVLSQATRIR